MHTILIIATVAVFTVVALISIHAEEAANKDRRRAYNDDHLKALAAAKSDIPDLVRYRPTIVPDDDERWTKTAQIVGIPRAADPRRVAA